MIEDSKNEQLNKNIDNVLFVYNEIFEQHEGSFPFKNKTINIHLSSNEENTEAKSIATFKKINTNFALFHENILNNCSNGLVDLANHWRDDDDKHEITAEEIKQWINTKDITIEIYEQDLTIYFENEDYSEEDDNDFFYGHCVVYYGNIDNDEFTVDIAG